jgi:hypothetical protein
MNGLMVLVFIVMTAMGPQVQVNSTDGKNPAFVPQAECAALKAKIDAVIAERGLIAEANCMTKEQFEKFSAENS